jgi:hypothetical protein
MGKMMEFSAAMLKTGQLPMIQIAPNFARHFVGKILLTALLAAACLFSSRSFAAGLSETNFTLESAGARYGLPANGKARGLQQAEIFSNYDLPWLFDLGAGMSWQSRLDATMGWIGGHGENAFVGTLGPSLVLRRRDLPLDFDVGSSLTLLSTHEWGAVNVGGRFQFTTHAGMDWDFATHWRVGYRFIHMSNAGIAHPNPGLNMHMIAFSFLF